PDQQTFFGMAGYDGRAAEAALEQSVAVVDAQPTLGIVIRGMAVVAVPGQQRAYLLLEELQRRSTGRRRRLASSRRGRGDRKGQHDGGHKPWDEKHGGTFLDGLAGVPARAGRPCLPFLHSLQL